MKAINNIMPYTVVMTLAESIIEGNQIYRKLYNEKRLPNINLNIPEAIEAIEELHLLCICEWVVI